MKCKRLKQAFLTVFLLASLSLSLFIFLVPKAEAQVTTLATTELINAYGINTSQINTFLALLDGQNITRFTFRINSMYEWDDSPPTMTGINKAKTVITAANALGIDVAIDLHTWYTTWDQKFDDDASSHATNRVTYINYVEDTLTSFSSSNVYAFMVMNEPQAQTASSDENQFIVDVINAGHGVTSKPISVRFMGGHSPTSSPQDYATAIDTASDFWCRNYFWDPRYPTVSVYQVSQSRITSDIALAHAAGKELWITECGWHKPEGSSWTSANLENQRAYAEAMVGWCNAYDVDLMSLWVSQPTATDNTENYNLFTSGSWTPHSAFYELVNEEGGEPPLGDNVVVLNQPNNLETFDYFNIYFNYTATFYQGSITNSSLWANVSGTWQRLGWNTTAITNATMHTINYTFTVETTYIWNIQVFNSTTAHWATSNRTLTIETTPPPDDPPYYGSHSVSTTVAGAEAFFQCGWDDDVSLSYGWLCHNNSGIWVNETIVGMFTPHLTFSDVITLNSTVGLVVSYRFIANDTASQETTTEVYTLTTTTSTFAPSTPYSPSGVFTVRQGIIFKTSSNNARFTMGAGFEFCRVEIAPTHLWMDKSYSAKHYTRYCIYVIDPDDTQFTVNSWFATKDSSATLTITSPLSASIEMGFTSPNLLSASVSGAASSSWNATTQTLAFVVNADVSSSFTITVTVTETEYNHAPENVDVQITDMEGCGNWVFSQTKFYTFQAKFWDGDGYADLSTCSIAFTDGLNWVNATYDLVTSTFRLDDGSDVARLKSGTVTIIDANEIQVTFPIYFQETILDADNVNIYMRCIDLYGATDGWEVLASATSYSLTINVSEDCQVRSSDPNANYDGATLMVANNHFTAGNVNSWLKFHTTSIPSTAIITSTIVYLYSYELYLNPTVNIHFSTTDSWSESTITWNNQPTYGEVLDSNVINVTNHWYSWVVTSDVEPQDAVSLCLETNSAAGCYAYFYSKEFENEYIAYLQVSYTILTPRFTFNIYNLGGHSTLETVGDAGRIVGGDIFDLYCGNMSSVEATIMFRDLQHVKMLATFQAYAGELGYISNITFFMEYCVGDVWVRPFSIVLTPSAAYMGSTVWWNWTATYYELGTEVKTEKFWCYYQNVNATQYTADTQLWVDLWFNRMDASTVWGARVNAYYYPMTDSASMWLRWLTGSNWGVDERVSEQSECFGKLRDNDGNIMSISNVKLVRVGCNITAGTIVTKLQHFTVFDLTFGSDPLEGVQTPPWDETKVPTMNQGGLLGSIWTGLAWFAVQIINGITWAAMTMFNVWVGFCDTVFSAMGFPNVADTYRQWLTSSISFLIESLNYSFQLLTMFFSFLTEYFGKIYTVLSMAFTTWMSMLTYFTAFLSGTYTAGINVWNDFGLSTWLLLGVILYPLYLVFLWEEEGLGAVIDQLTFLYNMLHGTVYMLLTIAEYIWAGIARLIEAIPVVE